MELAFDLDAAIHYYALIQVTPTAQSPVTQNPSRSRKINTLNARSDTS